VRAPVRTRVGVGLGPDRGSADESRHAVDPLSLADDPLGTADRVRRAVHDQLSADVGFPVQAVVADFGALALRVTEDQLEARHDSSSRPSGRSDQQGRARGKAGCVIRRYPHCAVFEPGSARCPVVRLPSCAGLPSSRGRFDGSGSWYAVVVSCGVGPRRLGARLRAYCVPALSGASCTDRSSGVRSCLEVRKGA
jgi:hypothetical protein